MGPASIPLVWLCLASRPGFGRGSQAISLRGRASPAPSVPRGGAELSLGMAGCAASTNVPKGPVHEVLWEDESGLHTPAASNPDALIDLMPVGQGHRPPSGLRVACSFLATVSSVHRTAALINYSVHTS